MKTCILNNLKKNKIVKYLNFYNIFDKKKVINVRCFCFQLFFEVGVN